MCVVLHKKNTWKESGQNYVNNINSKNSLNILHPTFDDSALFKMKMKLKAATMWLGEIEG